MTQTKMYKPLAVLAIAAAAVIFATAKPVTAGHHEEANATIVDIAVSAGSFDTLVVALKEAGLVETLSGDGPFTVFAPTDEAFAKIPQDQLNALLADKAQLTKVLTYHVLSGKVMAADVKAGKVTTVEGSDLTISTAGGVKVDNANVIKTDIVGSNGVIHVIDTVVMPN